MNTWILLGLSAAVAAMFCFGASELLQSQSYFEACKWYICLAFGGVGAALWLLGQWMKPKLAPQTVPRSVQHASTDAEDESNPNRAPVKGRMLRYWGPMLVVFAVILACLAPQPGRGVLTVAARTPQRQTFAPLPAPRQRGVEATSTSSRSQSQGTAQGFKLQGITFGQPQPSALINGRTYFAGDYVGDSDTRIKSIATDEVVLEAGGKTMSVQFGQGMKPLPDSAQ